MKLESRYYTSKEVQQMLGVGKTKAYQIIRQLNEIWVQRGKIAVNGKVAKTIFNEFYPN